MNQFATATEIASKEQAAYPVKPVKPQLLTDCVNPEALFRSPEWVAEEKMDGDRCIVTKRNHTVIVTTRNGNSFSIKPDAMIMTLALLSSDDWTIDGEFMPGGNFIAFDLIELNGQQCAAMANGARRELLSAISPFPMVERAVGEDAKRELHAKVRDMGGEGIVFKRLDAIYEEGCRVNHQQRHKNYESDSFIVGVVNIRKCSFEVWRDGKCYGHVSCGLNRLPLTGQEVRVRYEKVTAKGKLLRATLSR